ncbi:MAG: pyridoxal-phosphate dependent enzyme [Thermosphaera sp.]
MKLAAVDTIKSEIPPLPDFIETLKDILKAKSTHPVMIDGGGRVLKGIEVYASLWALGAGLVPVAEQAEELGERVPLEALDYYRSLMKNPGRVFESVAELAEKDAPTPLVRLKSLSKNGARVWAKLEWYHPFSLSIKDRVASAMISHALKKGLLKHPRLFEPTSTNTGLGLVGLGNFYGLKTRIYLPSTAQRCVDYLFAAMGAEVSRRSVPLTTQLIREVIEDAGREGAVVLNQFENDLNLIAHLRGTAKELDYQVKIKGLKPRLIVSGMGTSGHISALSLYFKNMYGGVKVYGVQPSQGSFIPGLRRVETGMKWIKYAELDGVLDVSLEEALEGVIQVSRSDGILLGLSAGAAAQALSKLIDEGGVEGDAILIVPDHGVKYIELLETILARPCINGSGENAESKIRNTPLKP